MTNLPELRRDLAEAKIALRAAKDHYQTCKAIVEHQALLAGGKNAEERAANVGVALRGDLSVREALDTLREAEAAVDRAEADVAGAEDERAVERLRVQERQAAALEKFANALAFASPAVAAAAVGVDTTEWFGR